MTEKSKFDRKTPSAGFLNFIARWVGCSMLIGIITIGTYGTITNRALYGDGQPLHPLVMILGVMAAGASVWLVSRWQHRALHNKTGREFKRWGFWSAVSWTMGMTVALMVTHRLLIRSGYHLLAAIGIMGLGLAIIYGFVAVCQSWLIGSQISESWVYGFVLVAGVLFWMLFIGDPERLVLGGILAPALQGLASGVIVMWLFHLAKLGNIAMKAKHEEVA